MWIVVRRDEDERHYISEWHGPFDTENRADGWIKLNIETSIQEEYDTQKLTKPRGSMPAW